MSLLQREKDTVATSGPLPRFDRNLFYISTSLQAQRIDWIYSYFLCRSASLLLALWSTFYLTKSNDCIETDVSHDEK